MVTVLDEFEVVTVPVSFVYCAGRFLPTKVRAFLDFAAPRLNAQFARKLPARVAPGKASAGRSSKDRENVT